MKRVVTGQRLLHQRLGPGEQLIRFLKTPLKAYGVRQRGQRVPGAGRITAEEALLNLQDAAKGGLGAVEVSRPVLAIPEPRQGIQAPDVLDADEFSGGADEGLGPADGGGNFSCCPARLLDPPFSFEDLIRALEEAKIRGEHLEGIRACARGRRGDDHRPAAFLGLALPERGRCSVSEGGGFGFATIEPLGEVLLPSALAYQAGRRKVLPGPEAPDLPAGLSPTFTEQVISLISICVVGCLGTSLLDEAQPTRFIRPVLSDRGFVTHLFQVGEVHDSRCLPRLASPGNRWVSRDEDGEQERQ